MTSFWEKLQRQYQQELPFVVYRKPGNRSVQAVFQNTNELFKIKSFNEKGFVFAPFDNSNSTVLIRPDKILKTPDVSDERKLPTTNSLPHNTLEQKDFHLNLVKAGIEHIHAGIFSKVVLSRKVEQPFYRDPIDLFQKLLSTYLSAFCYMFYHPKVGLWLGATPELLLHMNSKKFSTMSLAATQLVENDEPPAWSKKELEEQSLVTEYIKGVLKNECETLHTTGLESVKAGRLWHLQTTISGRIEGNKTGKLVKILHPTPAVCGIPKKATKEFILKNEGYDREYYTGYLGELNFGTLNDPKTQLFVNLRCMQLKGNKAHIYIGGGITAYSVPENEWEETVHKSGTMLNILVNTIN